MPRIVIGPGDTSKDVTNISAITELMNFSKEWGHLAISIMLVAKSPYCIDCWVKGVSVI